MSSPSTEKSLQSQLSLAIEAGLPGVSVAIGSRGNIIWQGAAGVSDLIKKTPFSSQHCFGVGSITKVFACVVILQLHEERLLSLEANVGDYLDNAILKDIPNAATASIASLLSHTSGIPSWEDEPAWIRVGRGSDVDPSRVWGKTETLDYVRHPVDPETWRPGKFAYSNTNFTLVGLIIEALTGNEAEREAVMEYPVKTVQSDGSGQAGVRSLSDPVQLHHWREVRNRIITPLGLSSIYLEGFEKAPSIVNLPNRYHYGNSVFRTEAGISKHFPEVKPGIIDASSSNLSVEWMAGGYIMSPKDLVHFAMALRDGNLLSAESMKILQAWQPAGVSMEIGHSIFRIDLGGDLGKVLGHAGSVLGFTGCFWWSEKSDCVVAVLANIGTMHAGSVFGAFSLALRLAPDGPRDFPELALRLAAERAGGMSTSGEGGEKP